MEFGLKARDIIVRENKKIAVSLDLISLTSLEKKKIIGKGRI